MPILSPRLLKSLNLTASQAQVYLAALELGQANIQQLAKKSGVKRTSIYTFLDELKDQQLIEETKKKKRSVYSAISPNQLLEIEKMRIKELEGVLPELAAIQNRARNKPRVTFYEGPEGIKQVYLDSLKEKKELIGFNDFTQSVALLGNFFRELYVPERVKRNMLVRALIPDTPQAREWAVRNNRDLRETKFMPNGNITTEINIYGDKVMLVSFRSHPSFGVIIEDKDIAATLRIVWQNLWDILPGEK